MTIPIQKISIQGVTVAVVREDLNHPVVQGNKLRKLKYNLVEAKRLHSKTILTFGGAYSNHLVATACAAQAAGFSAIGVVRGDELRDRSDRWSKTLKDAQQYGMRLCFVSRSDYKLKEHSAVVQEMITTDKADNGKIFIVPEGGSNQLAVQGVTELIDAIYQQEFKQEHKPSHIFCPVGTGGTLAGVIAGVTQHDSECQVIGTVVLKGLHDAKDEINQWLGGEQNSSNWQLLTDYHFGGYAKSTESLRDFAIEFEQKYHIPLDKIYNAKSFFALNDWINQGLITTKDSPFIINTGGLQGGQFGNKS